MAGNRADRLFNRTPADIVHRDRITSAKPSRSDIAASAPYSRQVYPWWIEKLPSSQDFNAQDFAMVVPAGAGNSVTSTNLVFAMPQTMIGVIQIFGIYVLTPTALTSLQFSLRINGAPVGGWDNIQNTPGVANLFVQNYSDLRVKIPMGATVDVLVTNLNANGPWTAGGKIAGWYHPYADALRISGDLY